MDAALGYLHTATLSTEQGYFGGGSSPSEFTSFP